MIRSFQVFNWRCEWHVQRDGASGIYFIDPEGSDSREVFEANELDRFTANNVMGKLFPDSPKRWGRTSRRRIFACGWRSRTEAVAPGSRITLVAEIGLPPGVHVYAPDVQGTGDPARGRGLTGLCSGGWLIPIRKSSTSQQLGAGAGVRRQVSHYAGDRR